jgi:hypothetical protein
MDAKLIWQTVEDAQQDACNNEFPRGVFSKNIGRSLV